MLLSNVILWAQESKVANDSTQTNILEEVIISATRTKRQLSSLPLPAQIINKKELKSSNSLRLNDILNEQTGIITVSDFGGGEGVQLQGLDSQYTLVLIDGVPIIGRSAGTLDLSRITVGNIKQIEVVKGPSSSLYGSEAIGGVINIITETPELGFNGNLDYRFGSFNTHDVNLDASYSKKKLAISVHVNRYSSDGYDLIDDSENINTPNLFSNQPKTVEPFVNYTFNPKIKYDFNDNTSAVLSYRYYLQDQDNVAISGGDILSGDAKLREWNTHFKLDHQFNSKWKSYLEFYATRYKAESDLFELNSGALFDESYFNQFLLRPELRTTYEANENHSFIGGIGWTNESLERTSFSTNPEFNSQYVYLQYDGHYFDKLNVILGARFDNHSEYESQFSPKLALRYKINDQVAVKGSIGYGFKAPDFRQLYFDFTNSTVGYTVLGYNEVPRRLAELDNLNQITAVTVPLSTFDSELKPESSVGYNLGFQYKPLNRLQLEVNLFRNDIKNLIDTRVIARKTNGQNVFSYYNVNKVFTQGIEFNANWKPINTLSISGGYQYLLAKDKDVIDNLENNVNNFARDPNTQETIELEKEDYFGLYNRSRHMANLKIYYAIPQWGLDANIRTTYRSKYGIFDSNGNDYLDKFDSFVDGYTIIDFAINKKLYKHFEIGAGIDNVFDFTDTENISNIAGSLIYGTLKINY